MKPENKRFIIIAQGGGYYGSAFFTTDFSFEKLKMAFVDEPGFVVEIDRINLFYAPDTQIVIKLWDGEPQDKAVVLFCSGHSVIDLHILNHLRTILRRPCMTNGSLEKKVRPWR